MLHIIERRRPDPEHPLLGAMFEARRRVFIDLLRWDLPITDGRYEIDRFDDAHAIYLVVTDQSGAHLASARLLSTTRPHILDTLFAALCEDEVPVGSRTFEITSEVLTPRRRLFRRPQNVDRQQNNASATALNLIKRKTSMYRPRSKDQLSRASRERTDP